MRHLHKVCKHARDALARRARSEPSRHADREERLWERSDRLWERELARWDAERRAWDTREAQLLQQVEELQHQLLRLARAQTAPVYAPLAEARAAPAQLGAPAPAPDRPSSAAWEAEPRAGQQPGQAGVAAHPAPALEPEEVAAAMERQLEQAFQAGSLALEDAPGGGAAGEDAPPFAGEWAAAVEAVDSTDVLANWREVLSGQVRSQHVALQRPVLMVHDMAAEVP
jgi:hypothetical protein